MDSNYKKWTLSVQIAPGFSPLSLPASGDWDTMTHGLRAFSIDRGRQDELDEFQPASCTLVLDNGDQDLDQLVTGSEIGDGNALPFTPVRIRATRTATAWSGATTYVVDDVVSSASVIYRCISGHTNQAPPNATYWVVVPTVTLFSGYTIDGWDPSGSLRGAGTVDVQLTDWLGWAVGVEMPESYWALWVAESQPALWWRGDMNATQVDGGDYGVFNEAARWNGGQFADAKVTGGSGVQATAGLVPGSNNQAMTVTEDALLELNPLELIGSSLLWSVAVWFRTVGGAGRNIVSGDDWQLRVDDGTGDLVIDIEINAVAHQGRITAGTHDDDAIHMAIVNVWSHTSGGIWMYSDQGEDVESVTEDVDSGGGQIASFDADDDIDIDEVVYWEGSFSPSEPAPDETVCAGWVADGEVAMWSESREDRFGRWCAAATVDLPDVEFTLDDPTVEIVRSVPSSLAAAAVQLGADGLGATWVTRSGALRVRDVTYTSAEADDYDDVQATISDDPAATGVVRATRRRSGTRLDRVINRVRLYVQGYAYPRVHVRDVTSQARYGLRTKDFASNIESLVDVEDLRSSVVAVLAARKDPTIEVESVTIQPWGNQLATDFVMERLELERRVAYREATPDNVEVLDGEYRVMRESWSWSDGLDWTVSLDLAPV